MTKKKTSVIAVAVLVCLVCASMIAGATFALFTDSDRVSISVTTAKVDVEAVISGEATKGHSDGVGSNNANLTADVTDGGHSLIINNMIPGDVVYFPITITNNSKVAVKYRVSLGCDQAESKLFDCLLLGVKDSAEATVPYDYYSSSVSAWNNLNAVTSDADTSATLYVALELPAFVTNDQVDNLEQCSISVAVEAVQGNVSEDTLATGSATNAVRVSGGTVSAADVAKLTNNGCLILDTPNIDWTITTNETKTFTVRGYNVGTLTVNAPNANIHYSVEATEIIELVAVAPSSFHVYGIVSDSLTVKEGRAVVEPGAQVAKAVAQPVEENAIAVIIANEVIANAIVNPAANTTATIVTNANVGTLSVQGDGKAEVTVPVDVTVGTIEVSNTNDKTAVTVDGKAEDIVVDENAGAIAISQKVSNAEELAKAVALGGKISLANDIVCDSLNLKKDVTIDMCSNTLTIETTRSSAITVSTKMETNIQNGALEIILTSGSDTKAINLSGSLAMTNVDFDAKLHSTATRNRSLYAIYGSGYKYIPQIKLENSDIRCSVLSQTNENIVISTTGVFLGTDVEATVSGGSICASTGFYTGNATPSLTIGDANITYVTHGINAQNGGTVTIQSGVTFQSDSDNSAILVHENKTVLNDSESGYAWTFDRQISDCSVYVPVSNLYVSGNVSKQVVTATYPQHTPGEYVYNNIWNEYKVSCTVCGQEIYDMSVPAGSSEEFYYPISDINSFTNAGLNALYAKLESDISVDNAYTNISFEKANSVLDLNGHTINVKGTCYLEISGVNVTIKNGKFVTPTGNSYALRLRKASATLENLQCAGGLNILGGSVVTINDCIANANGSDYYAIYASDSDTQVTVNSGSYECGSFGMVVYAENNAVMTIDGGAFVGAIGGTGVSVNGGTFVTRVKNATQLSKALSYSLPNYTIFLEADFAYDTHTVITDKDIVVDLNGHTITSKITGRLFKANGTTHLTVKNGTISVASMSAGDDSVIVGAGKAVVNCEKLNIVPANGDELYFAGYGIAAFDEAQINIKECKIVRGTPVSTNALANEGYTLNQCVVIDHSVLEGFATGLMFNAPGTLTVQNNSVISGINQAVVVRAGTATIKDSRLYNTLVNRTLNGGAPIVIQSATEFNSYYETTAWGTGTERIPLSTLIVGCGTAGYANPAKCTLINTVVENTFANCRAANDGTWVENYAVLVWGNADIEYTAICEYDSATRFVLDDGTNNNQTKVYGNGSIAEITVTAD